MKKNLRTAGITGTLELKDGDLVSLDDCIPQNQKAAVKFVRKIKTRGVWINRSAEMFGTEEYIFPEDIGAIAVTYEPITVPARPERSVLDAT